MAGPALDYSWQDPTEVGVVVLRPEPLTPACRTMNRAGLIGTALSAVQADNLW
jgi:hypothetical protein